MNKNFPSEFQPRETVDLFLQSIIEVLNDKGRAAVVLSDGTLFGEGVKTKIKKLLLDECNLHTVVRLPNSVFAWKVSIDDITARNYNLDIKNPHVGEVISHDPEELLADYAKQQDDIKKLRDQLKNILSDALSH